MNTKQKQLLVFILLGFIFSSILRIKFNVGSGFEFENYWITIPLPFFDWAVAKSSETSLTSTFIGYFFVTLFGIKLLHYLKPIRQPKYNLLGFTIVAFIAFIFEASSIIIATFSSYLGQHMRIGPLLFVWALLMFLWYYKFLKR